MENRGSLWYNAEQVMTLRMNGARQSVNHSEKKMAHYHLPGLFEFYELYAAFLPLFREHREFFYDWCDIGSIYAFGEAGVSAAATMIRATCWR